MYRIHETSRVRPTAKTLSPAYRLTRIQSGSLFLRALGSEPCSRDLGGARGRPELASSLSRLARTTSRRRNLPEREVQQDAPAASDELLRKPRQRAFASAARGRRRCRYCPGRGSLRADSGGGHAHLRALSPVVPPRLCSFKNSFPRTTPNGGMASSPSCL